MGLTGGLQAQEWQAAAKLSPAPKLPVAAFAQLGRFSGPSISPDGKKLAFLRGINGRKHVVIQKLDAPDAAPIGVPPSNADYEFRWVEWANNDRLLIGLGTQANRGDDGLVSFSGKTRETRLLSASADGTSAVNMYRPVKREKLGTKLGTVTSSNFAVVQDNVIHYTPDDPDTVLMSVIEDYADEGGAAVRKVNVKTGSYQTIMTGRPNVWRYETDLQANVRLGWSQNISGNKINNFIWYKDPKSSWVKIESGLMLNLDTDFIGFSPDPAIGYAITPMEGRRSLVKFDVARQAITETVYRNSAIDVDDVFYNEIGDVIGVKLSGDGETAFFDPAWAARNA